MKNIVLVGMPSCGKSTVGVLLAKNLGYKFIDTDLLIQQKQNKLLCEIISDIGPDAFLRIENEVGAAIDTENTVISTGGSMIYSEEAMTHLKENGIVIYLKIDYDTLCQRLGDYVHRGVVLKNGATLADMYAERSFLYEKYSDAFVTEFGSIGETLKSCEVVTRRLLGI